VLLNALNDITIIIDNFIYNKIIEIYKLKNGLLYVKILVSLALKGLREINKKGCFF
jgi:hypothetical protein